MQIWESFDTFIDLNDDSKINYTTTGTILTFHNVKTIDGIMDFQFSYKIRGDTLILINEKQIIKYKRINMAPDEYFDFLGFHPGA